MPPQVEWCVLTLTCINNGRCTQPPPTNCVLICSLFPSDGKLSSPRQMWLIECAQPLLCSSFCYQLKFSAPMTATDTKTNIITCQSNHGFTCKLCIIYCLPSTIAMLRSAFCMSVLATIEALWIRNDSFLDLILYRLAVEIFHLSLTAQKLICFFSSDEFSSISDQNLEFWWFTVGVEVSQLPQDSKVILNTALHLQANLLLSEGLACPYL